MKPTREGFKTIDARRSSKRFEGLGLQVVFVAQICACLHSSLLSETGVLCWFKVCTHYLHNFTSLIDLQETINSVRDGNRRIILSRGPTTNLGPWGDHMTIRWFFGLMRWFFGCSQGLSGQQSHPPNIHMCDHVGLTQDGVKWVSKTLQLGHGQCCPTPDGQYPGGSWLVGLKIEPESLKLDGLIVMFLIILGTNYKPINDHIHHIFRQLQGSYDDILNWCILMIFGYLWNIL